MGYIDSININICVNCLAYHTQTASITDLLYILSTLSTSCFSFLSLESQTRMYFTHKNLKGCEKLHRLQKPFLLYKPVIIITVPPSFSNRHFRI